MTKIVGKSGRYVGPANVLLKMGVGLFFKLPFIKDKTIGDSCAEEIVKLYSRGEYAGLSAKIRFWDAPLQAFEKRVPKTGVILDLGCGEGILTNYLALSSKKRRLIGIEFNRLRVRAAEHGVKNAKFVYRDVLKTTLPKSDSIVISHMLHHLPSQDDQIKLIRSCFRSLRKDGKLIIAEVDKNWLYWKYWLGWIVDVVVVPILFERQVYDTRIFHRSGQEWRNLLRKHNFKVEKIEPVPGGPFPDLFITAIKK